MEERFPVPVKRAGKWIVDLRSPWRFGWRYVLGPDSMTETEALNRAWARLAELQVERALASVAPPPRALAAPPPPSVTTFGQVLDEWTKRKEYDTAAGAEYGRKTAKAVRGDVAGLRVTELVGASGEDVWLEYKRQLEARGLGARTVRNRFSVVGQVLRFAAGRQWLPGVPRLPKMPRKPRPRFDWIDEPSFRAVRAAIYAGEHGGHLTGEDLHGESVELYVARRRVYLSWLMYTGVHLADAQVLDDGFVALDVGTYVRQNSKSADHVPNEEFELPEPLVDDLRELLRLLGREAFFCGERIAGGPWLTVNRVMAAAQRRVGIPGPRLNTRILRRSYAREMFRRGYTLQEVADRMGHVDVKMLREIYLRTPRPAGAARTRWKRVAIPGTPLTHSGARVIPFLGLSRRPQTGEGQEGPTEQDP